MTDRAEHYMKSVWEARHDKGADTENKLTAEILRLAIAIVPQYNTQIGMVAINREDLLALAQEVESL
jgi:hypothetical protein